MVNGFCPPQGPLLVGSAYAPSYHCIAFSWSPKIVFFALKLVYQCLICLAGHLFFDFWRKWRRLEIGLPLCFLLCTRVFLASGFCSRELKRNGKRARATLLVVFFWSRSRTSGRVFQSSNTSVSGRQKSSEFDRFWFDQFAKKKIAKIVKTR